MPKRPVNPGSPAPARRHRAGARCARLATGALMAAALAGPLAAGPGAAAPPTPDPTPSAAPTLPLFSQRTPPVGGDRLTGAGLVTDLPIGVPPPPDFQAGAYLIADLDSGDVIATKAPHAMYLPASTMKTLTTLALVNRLGHSTQVTATQEDAAVDGTKVGMDPGAPYPVGSLFAALMMSSANDAAVALARVNGGLDETTAQMNALAEHLGALDTIAKNTSGLDAPGQLTSVYDLALIGRAAVNDAAVRPLLVRKTDEFPGGRTKKGRQRTTMQIANHNRLLWNYDGTIGVKNGYTNAAGATYIGAVRRGDDAYIFTYLKAQTGAWRPTADMFDWAFEHGGRARPVGRLVDPGELEEAEKQAQQEHATTPPAAEGDGSGSGALDTAREALQPVITAASHVADTAGDAAAEASRHLPSPLDDPRVVIGGVVALLALGVAIGVRLRRR